MNDVIDRHVLLEKYRTALGVNHPGELAESNLIEAISATQAHLGVLISLYKDVTGEDITEGVIEALRKTISDANS